MHAIRQTTFRETDLQALLNTQPLAMLVYDDDTGTFVSANAAAVRLFDRSEQAIINARPPELFMNGRKLQEQARKFFASPEALDTPTTRVREVQLNHENERRYVDIYLGQVQTESRLLYVLTLVNVTRHVLTAETVAHENALLSQLYTNSPDATVELDLNDRVQSINPAFTQLFGYAEADLLGKRLEEFIVPEDEEAASAELALQVLKEGKVYAEAARINRQGERIICAITGYSICANGVVIGLYAEYKDIRHLAAEREALERVAYEDDLTRLHNRRGFETACHKAMQEHRLATLLFIDLDNFKPVNDTYGHLVGDKALQEIADCLRSAVRATDIIGRIGGDEFGILLVDCDQHNAGNIAESIIASVQRVAQGIGREEADAEQPIQLGVSIGIAQRKDMQTSYEDWLDAADAACYEAKSAGKNTFRVTGEL